MSWNYRVIDRHNGELAIFSVYYHESGEIRGVSNEPSSPRGYEGDITNLKVDLKRYSDALLKPILIDKGNDVYEEKK